MQQKNKSLEQLESLPITRLLWKYFLPAFTGVIINSLYNIVDRIFIGQGVGALALAGLSTVFPIMLIMMGFGMLIGLGAGVRISINLGKRDLPRAEKVLGNAFILMLIVSVIITIIGFSIKGPMLTLFGASSQTADYANSYLNIILFGSIFNVVGFSLNNLIRSEGNAKTAMYSMMISAGTNIILDPIFIFVFDFGVAGAAWATVISQAILCIWVIAHFRSKRANIKLKRKNFALQKDIIVYIITIGFAPFAMQIAGSLVQGTFNTQLIKFGGDIAVGAMGIINSVAMLIVMSIIAINMAAQPIFGYSYGAKQYDRLKETLRVCLLAATTISVVGFVAVELFPSAIIKLFNNSSEELLTIGKQGIRIFFAAFPIVGFQVITSNYFQSTGKAGKAAFLSLLRQVIVLIPALIFLPKIWGLQGVWIASPVADIIAAAISATLLVRELKRLNQM